MASKKRIVCSVCGKQHRSTGSPSGTQGIDCAARYFEQGSRKFVLGRYGSDFDGNIYEFRGDVPGAWKNAKQPICDACLRLALSEGRLVQIPGEYPWGPYRWKNELLFDGNLIPIDLPPAPVRQSN